MKTLKIGNRTYFTHSIVWFEHHSDIQRELGDDGAYRYTDKSKFSIGFSDGSSADLSGASATKFASEFETSMNRGELI